MTTHTPTPWSADGAYVETRGERLTTLADCARSPRIDIPTAKANAEFIVKAVNMHDALVEALRDLSEASRNACNAAQHSPLIDALFTADELIAKATP